MKDRQHYSNKGGHLERSLFHKAFDQTIKHGVEQPCKGTISYCARRFAKRVPDDGKR